MDEVDNNSKLEMMLSMPVTVVAHSRTRMMFNSRPSSQDWYTSSYTIRLQFQNTIIETDIPQQDPRYDTIKYHLEKNGVKL